MIKLNDPRITAYLLGELDPAQVEVIEQALRSSPTLAKNVEQMRQTIELLKIALPEEGVLPSSNSRNENPVVDKKELDPKAAQQKNQFHLYILLVVLIGILVVFYCINPYIKNHQPVTEPATPTLITQAPDYNFQTESGAAAKPGENSQRSPQDAWKEYGFTSDQVEQFNSSADPSASDNDVISLFPVDAVNRKQRELINKLQNDNAWSVKPQNNNDNSGLDLSNKLIVENPVTFSADAPDSTFELLPGSASWRLFASAIKNNSLPAAQTVRVDQYVNHFKYAVTQQGDNNAPFTVSVQIGPHPWISGLLLAKIDIASQDEFVAKNCAQNASVQVHFNSQTVAAYRLLGNEKRLTEEETTPYKPPVLPNIPQKFQTCALYELELTASAKSTTDSASSLFTVEISYGILKTTSYDPDVKAVAPDKQEYRVDIPSEQSLQQTEQNADFQFAAAVALFAQILQNSEYNGSGTMETVITLLEKSVGTDPLRTEFLEQVKSALPIITLDKKP